MVDMCDMPDFSIITPSLNYGNYIRECINSVLVQKDVTYEHIILDAGSTDNTHKVMSNYSHLQVIVESDEGMSDAINKGFARAKGNWVMWLNADDRLKSGALAEILRISQKHPTADVIHGTCDFVNAGGDLIRRWKSLPYHHFVHVHHNNYIPSTATFFKKKTVLDEGYRLDIRFRIAMDKEFYARLRVAGKHFVYVPCSIADFRWHDENLSKPVGAEKNMDTQLKIARQGTESEAIRRVYGFTPVKKRWVYGICDGIFFAVAAVIKQFLKIPYWRSTYVPPAS